MNEVLAIYVFPGHNDRVYLKEDLLDHNKVIEVFDYCQIAIAFITKAGWSFLIDYYGHESMR